MNTINILIGKKGSGKTYIGRLIEKQFNIPFLDVEAIFLQVIKNRDAYDRHYIQEGFAQVEQQVRELLNTNEQMCFEATGLTQAFQKMIANLEQHYKIQLIHINTNADICLERAEIREQSRQIPLTRDQITDINLKVERQIINYDLVLNNDDSTDEKLLNQLQNFYSTQS